MSGIGMIGTDVHHHLPGETSETQTDAVPGRDLRLTNGLAHLRLVLSLSLKPNSPKRKQNKTLQKKR